jgi:hypothetical protein
VRTSSRVLRQPPPIGAKVAAVIGAEVAAAAGEAAHCKGGCLRWQDHQRHLPPSLQLFGFNGLVVAPPWEDGGEDLFVMAHALRRPSLLSLRLGGFRKAVAAAFQRDPC